MTHLDERTLADVAEGLVEPAVAEHLSRCAECRSATEELRQILQQVSAADVPSPSPLYWPHFRARVAEAIDAPPAAARAGSWSGGLRFRWLTTAAVAVTIALIVGTLRLGPTDAPLPSGTPGATASIAPVVTLSAEPADDIEADEAWAMVRSVAEDLDYESAHEAGVTPGAAAIEGAALELTAAEQGALKQLIEQEMKRTDS